MTLATGQNHQGQYQIGRIKKLWIGAASRSKSYKPTKSLTLCWLKKRIYICNHNLWHKELLNSKNDTGNRPKSSGPIPNRKNKKTLDWSCESNFKKLNLNAHYTIFRFHPISKFWKMKIFWGGKQKKTVTTENIKKQ